ncbi:MAG: beta-lactamase family protein [Winogradskyella sp.]|uniref:serine hydrolase domain-containing protein n=1 Tax=Winogradskyella sp. TaxID=1883156 RepID=UPI0025F0C0FD|nr:serine hydrolase domain-containing protein [Winogradskyella sp.]NRB60438.1 beta-lactamase family protein [Winogradskyella sp.]
MATGKMKNILRALFIMASIGSLYFVPWLLVKAWILPLPDSLQEQAEEAVGHGFDGVVIYVDQAGKPPLFAAAGWHNRDTKVPARTDAFFKIASISKLYDAVAVTKLVADGRLALDNTIADYLPDLKGKIDNAEEVTLRLMIQHRSGLPNFTDTPGFWEAPTGTFEEGIALIYNQPANFEPGEDYEYCNTNYLLLNKIMDDLLGYDNFQFIEEEILTPQNLKNTKGWYSDVNIDNLMSGYHVGYPHDLKGNGYDMIATAEDVGIFLRALNDGSLFEPKEREIYSTLYKYEHSGWVPGYQSFAEYHKDIDAVVVAFYSTTDAKLFNWNLSEIVNGRLVKIIEKTTKP